MPILPSLTITNARAVVDGKIRSCNIRIINGRVQGILPPGDTYGKTHNAKNLLVLPGFIDVHAYGAGGLPFNRAGAKDFREARDSLASQGVTVFLPSITADTEEDVIPSLMAAQEAKSDLQCHQIHGVHLEGPFPSPRQTDAAHTESPPLPGYSLIQKLQNASGGIIRRITLAPEREGAAGLAAQLRSDGISVAMGHSSASYEEAAAAIGAGVHCVAHLFSDMPPLVPLRPGIAGAALASDIYCEIICDGRRLHPGTISMVFQAKGAKRTIAVTGGAPGGENPGEGDVPVPSKGHSGVLPMPALLQNFIGFTERNLEDVIDCFTSTPARMMGIYHRKGSIDVGIDADLVILNRDYTVNTTFSCGAIIYRQQQ
jgi:N-acetylglucosamine-6-phosphate deacetylase